MSDPRDPDSPAPEAGVADGGAAIAARLLEAGMAGAEGFFGLTRRAVATLAGRRPPPAPSRAPEGRPTDVDAATSLLANRLLRVALRTGTSPDDLLEAAGDALAAVARSFPRLDPRDPRQWLGLPLELPLSLATLALQEGRRALAAAQAVPPELLPDFTAFVTEIFTDLHVYFSLDYDREIRRFEARVRRRPGDAGARLDLGRTYLKCGLFREAARELDRAAQDAGSRHRALYERTVALYRAGDYAEAVDAGAACLAGRPNDDRARHWLWLAAQAAGGYPESVSSDLRMEVREGWHEPRVELEEVAEEIGLDKVSGGRGTAVADFCGNGRLDVVVAGAHSGVSLFRNDGDGTFTDVSTGSGLDACVYAFALVAGDYDNDGRPDLYVTSLGFYDGQGRLFHNNGDGTFTDVTHESGVGSWGPGFTATWVDYDGDGYLDLFVANNLGGLFDRKTPNRLFHNSGDGTFTDVTRAAGLAATPWPTLGAAWGDFRNNGRPDLFLSNLGRAQLFRNNGDGTFTDVSRRAGIDAPAIGSVAHVLDVDDDGWLDIVQHTYSRPQQAIHTLRHGEGPPDGSPTRIFRNRRDGTFELVSEEMGITGCWGTMSAAAGDFDNDGHLDLLLGNGDPSMDRTEGSMLLAYDGKHRYRNVTFAAGLPFTGKGHGANFADLAGDGRLHLIVGAGGLYPGDLLTSTVFRPKTRPGNYLNVRLVGTVSNRDAIGARLALEAGGRTQHRLVSGGTNFGCLPTEQHFGLGRRRKVGPLTVRWPSGLVQAFEELPFNSSIRITEGRDGWEEVYTRKSGKKP